MGAFLLRRLWQAALVLLAVTVLVFLMIYLGGDPVRALVPLDAAQADVENIRHQYGLDAPLWQQYLTFLLRAGRGDMGESFKFHEPAMGLVLSRLPATALLAMSSVLLAILVSLPLGIVAATRPGSPWDQLATAVSVLAISTPAFWLGIVLILVFAGELRWFPTSGTGGLDHLVLPAITLSASSIGLLIRLVRASMGEALRQQYLVTARAKGLPDRLVVVRHGLRNALIPIVTVAGLQLGTLLGGSVIIETVFAWPGVGLLLVQAISARDLPLIRADVLIVATMFLAINLLTDVAYSYIDPRIRVS
jgi:peptide/nickel transport system permease protein